MKNQIAQLGELCKSVNLLLVQFNKRSEVCLAGEVLKDDCLLLHSEMDFLAGEPASLAVTFLEQSFNVEGVVNSVDRMQGGYHISFQLNEKDGLQTRMLLQLSEIEQYRLQKEKDGIKLSLDEAAAEWVDLYAAEFAELFSSPPGDR